MNAEEARVKILHLAAEVAETEDNNVPVLLKQLQELLTNYPAGTELGVKIRQDIWNYDVLHVCSLALLQDFSPIEGGWSTAASLCFILCQCCDRIRLESSLDFNETFLPSTLDNMLNLLFKIQEVYLATETNKKHELYKNYKDITDSILWLLSYSPNLSIKVLESKRIMQMMMVEDEETSLLILVLMHCILRKDRNVFKKLNEENRNSLLDELIYKISASEDISVGRSACQLLLIFIDRQPAIVELLSSRKYRGLRTYLSKWKGKSFDQDLKKLTAVLEAGNIAQAHLLKKDLAASVIQAYYRGYKERKMLKKMVIGFTKFQRLYRQHTEKTQQERAETRWRREVELNKDISRKRDFRQSLNKKLETLEYVPANRLEEFLVEKQKNAAVIIQAAFRGARERKQLSELKKERKERNGAIVIQRQFRKYLQRKKDREKTPLQFGPPGLDDRRRAEIQEKILRYREDTTHKHWTFETVKERHYETQRLLGNHLMLHGKTRKSEQRREALLAKISVDAELILAAPKLKELSSDVVDIYTSRSTPVITKAQINHSQELLRQKFPWWKKLWDEDEREEVTHYVDKDLEELNF